MKKRLTILLLCIIGINTVYAQSKNDYDSAAIKIKYLYNQLQTDSIYNMMSARLKTLAPKDKLEGQLKQMYSQAGSLLSCNFTKEQKGIYFYKTTFSNAILSMVLVIDKDKKLSTFRFVPYVADTSSTPKEKSNIVLKTSTGSVYGTLLLPETTKKIPMVLIIAGSGPTDRNGNNNMGLSTNAYKMLADSLQKAGIASVRYDKRTVGESIHGPDDRKLIFNDLVNDAGRFIKMLKEDKRFSLVIVAGHSEGSLIGMMAANNENANAFISISGIAERVDKILEKQLAYPSGDLAEKAKIVLDSLDKGYKVKNIDSDLTSYFNPSIQPYMISWLKYEPRQEIKKLKIPVLILQGTTDLQVTVDEAEKLKQAYPKASLKIIPGMNHVLKQAPADREKNAATYSDPDLPLSPGLIPAIIKFVSACNKGK